MFVYENGVFTAVPCTKKNSYLSIRDFAEGRDRTIYVASTSGVCRVRSGLLVPYSNPYITGETAYALGIDRYGRLWCAMSTGKCAVMQDDRVLAMLDAELFFEDGSVISCLTSDRANNIYLGTDGSTLAKVACSGQRLDGTAFIVQTYEATDAANHNRVGVTAEGDILVSGQQGFAWVTADGTQRDPHTGTSTDAVNCAALDTEGNVWLASSNEGLIRYSPGCFASPNLAAGLTDMDINAVTAAGGRYYAAVNQGLLAFDSDWQPVSNKLTQALAGVHVQSLMTDSRGRLRCGTYSELGLVRYDTGSGELVFFNQSNGLGSMRIRVAFELRDGTVAVGTQDGLALIRGDKVVAFYDKDSGLETQSILCIVQAPDGTLLAGSAGSGIYALAQDGSITKFSYEQGLEDGVVLRILQEEDGRSAFVSAGSHLYYWADGTFRRLDGLRISPGSIFDLYERDGKLWLLQDSGIYALDKARILAGETPHATQHGTARGLTGSLRVNTCNYMAPDGSLYLATRNGVSVFDFREISAPHAAAGHQQHPRGRPDLRVPGAADARQRRPAHDHPLLRADLFRRHRSVYRVSARGLCQSQDLHRGNMAGGLDGELCESKTQTVHVQDQPRFYEKPHQAANRQNSAGRPDFSGLAAVLQTPVGQWSSRPCRSEKETERSCTQDGAEHPPDDRLGV